ncbi:MAG: putative sigma54 specific transcriptional regulator [Clostridia bacterium]|jgi:PAS domain S-box-containing protein|nr:putative sigma54 specific transcriptional regulator [Clostridia bacterium]
MGETVLAPGVLILDNNGMIINSNSTAMTYLNMNNIIGKKFIKTMLSTYSTRTYKLEDMTIVIFTKYDEAIFYSTIINASYDEIFVTDNKGIAIFCNNSFEKNYGVSKQKILGKHVNYLVENGYADVTYVDQVIKYKSPMTFEQKTKPGKTILNTCTPVFDSSAELKYIVQNCRDITEIEQLKNNLFNVKKELNNYKKELEDINYDKESKIINFTSPQMKSIYKIVDKFGPKEINMLILGQTGTGKSSIAKYIHECSSRKDGPFVTINCSAINKELIESELFGYSAGAFTGALKGGKVGLVQLANKGTLFLDEIGELPLYVQTKLLELVQEKTFIPVGDVVIKRVDTRIIAATNQDLKTLMDQGDFRVDLYYRLAGVTLTLPPLFERKEDLLMLLTHFMKHFDIKHNLKTTFTNEAIEILLSYSWPGNIRELEHLVEFLVLNSQGKAVQIHDLPISIVNSSRDRKHKDCSLIDRSLKDLMESEERRIVREYYSQYQSSYKLSKVLGISQTKANRLIQKHCK